MSVAPRKASKPIPPRSLAAVGVLLIVLALCAKIFLSKRAA